MLCLLRSGMSVTLARNDCRTDGLSINHRSSEPGFHGFGLSPLGPGIPKAGSLDRPHQVVINLTLYNSYVFYGACVSAEAV